MLGRLAGRKRHETASHLCVCLFSVERYLRGSRIHRIERGGGGAYGVVPKGLLTFLGSLHKEVAKTTAGTLVYRFERQTEKYCVLNLECRILSQEPSDSFSLYFSVIFHGK